MIERSIYEYLRNDSQLNTGVGGRIYLIRVPTQDTIVLPWLVIENIGATRIKIAQNKIEEKANVRITVDAESTQLVLGRSIIDRAHVLLENYRGMLYNSSDVSIQCSGISGTSGIGGVYRYFFSCVVKSLDDYIAPEMYKV
jgi:hypothetical protein